MGDLHMENRNSYFKPVIVNTDFYLQFFPAMEGGKSLDIKEVMSYLNDMVIKIMT